jgi:hypothetical protein
MSMTMITTMAMAMGMTITTIATRVTPLTTGAKP